MLSNLLDFTLHFVLHFSQALNNNVLLHLLSIHDCYSTNSMVDLVVTCVRETIACLPHVTNIHPLPLYSISWGQSHLQLRAWCKNRY